METVFGTAFEYKLIYVFAINDEAHKGLLKIGDTTIQSDASIDALFPNCKALNQAALSRIKQYTNTAGISAQLLHTELAVHLVRGKDGQQVLKAFRDYDVHRVLENSGIPKKKLKNSTSREWFEVDLSTVLKAIEAVKKCQPNLSGVGAGTGFTPIVFRPEQEEAIEKTLKQFKTGSRMLWNAKMRFGKTLSALQVVKKSGFAKTIIVTHRPVVDDGWYEDFQKIFYDTDDYTYGSKGHGAAIEDLLNSGKEQKELEAETFLHLFRICVVLPPLEANSIRTMQCSHWTGIWSSWMRPTKEPPPRWAMMSSRIWSRKGTATIPSSLPCPVRRSIFSRNLMITSTPGTM